MILRLVVPFLETFSEGGTLAKWHVQVGSQVEFGDPICDIALSEWVALRKTKRAVNLVKFRDKGGSNVRHNFEKRQGRGVLVMRVKASEGGYLREVRVPEGQKVSVGDLLALVTTEAAESIADASEAPVMRVVATNQDVMEGSV